MRIAIIGYGKMGKAIEEIAINRGHQTIAFDIMDNLDALSSNDFDAAIEFTGPESAPENLKKCLDHHIPVVCGSTGWLDRKEEIDQYCRAKQGTFFYASNYSIGVNIFFRANAYLAKLIAQQGYQASIHEIHHTQKKDSPSGTAITLAEDMLRHLKEYNKWSEGKTDNQTLAIYSERIDPYPGKHSVKYESDIDIIEMTHTAKSRIGFALGAVLVAEWITDKKGILSMNDFLPF
jgi:4-hydroxy-tetrahydrodipicolinate reductase